jgi:hypothetical protein
MGWVKGQPIRFISGHNSRLKRKPLNERFWAKVNKRGPLPSKRSTKMHPDIADTRCWFWTGAKTGSGYGSVGIEPRRVTKLAHRVAWFLATGKWPNPQALHKCDNRLCVRFSHLFEGTNSDNVADTWAKWRLKMEKEQRTYYVDIPTSEAIGDPEGAFQNVAVFHTHKEAIEFAQREFGADNQGRVQLVTG